MIKDIKIISGGQSGVDRAALDFALKNQISCGGWCPKGRLAEDGRLHPKYPLMETDSTQYHVRTKANVLEADGTLIICYSEPGGGTALTLQLTRLENKPFFIFKLDEACQNKLVKFLKWLTENKIAVLNIAGPRESESPGVYSKALGLFESIIASIEDKTSG